SQGGAHRGRDVGIGGELLERIAWRQRQHHEQHDADADETRNRDQQAPEQIPTHDLAAARRTPCSPFGFRAPHASRYQFASCQRSRSQPLSGACSPLATVDTRGRYTTGMTVWLPQTRSFMRMNRAARLIGSSSPSAARKVLSYSSLRQRVMLRPCHLFALEASSQEQN